MDHYHTKNHKAERARGQKNKRADRKGESNDSPEIPDREHHTSFTTRCGHSCKSCCLPWKHVVSRLSVVLFSQQFCSSLMSRNKFMDILTFLHVNNATRLLIGSQITTPSTRFVHWSTTSTSTSERCTRLTCFPDLFTTSLIVIQTALHKMTTFMVMFLQLPYFNTTKRMRIHRKLWCLFSPLKFLWTGLLLFSYPVTLCKS